jgi:hypothetical protein
LKKGITKDEAGPIIEKLKELGATVVLEWFCFLWFELVELVVNWDCCFMRKWEIFVLWNCVC